jgi:hypothetical protein
VSNHTLTISPEQLSKVHLADLMWLHLFTRGSKLMAAGTETEPIIFTSSSPNPQSGDWAELFFAENKHQYKL